MTDCVGRPLVDQDGKTSRRIAAIKAETRVAFLGWRPSEVKVGHVREAKLFGTALEMS